MVAKTAISQTTASNVPYMQPDRRLNRIHPARLIPNVQITDIYLLATTEKLLRGMAIWYFFQRALSSLVKLIMFCMPIVMANRTEAINPP